MTLRITFETETCIRCGGTGEYPSPAWQGMCMKCKRKGVVLTRFGRIARKRFNERMEAMKVLATDVRVGDHVRSALNEKWLTVTEIKDDSGVSYLNPETDEMEKMSGYIAGGMCHSFYPSTKVYRWSAEVFTESVEACRRLKGATITEVE